MSLEKKNKISVTEQEMQNEIQKQLRMMPGQEKMVQEYYQKNPSVLANLRGSIYEEKIIREIKVKAKANKKEITKEQAEKLLKEENEKHLKDHANHAHTHDQNHSHEEKKDKKSASSKKDNNQKKAKSPAKKTIKTKKVSKK